MTKPARFPSKELASAAAEKRVLAAAVWIAGTTASVEKVVPGWYVGWPQNVRKFLLSEAEASA